MIIIKLKTDLRDIGVIKQTKADRWQWIYSILCVSWQHNQWNCMLDGIAEGTFERNVRPQDEPLRPAVLAQTLNLSPQTFKILQHYQITYVIHYTWPLQTY